MFDLPGHQYAIWDTVKEEMVREIDYQDVNSWAKDYEEGNSRFAVITREIPRWRFYHIQGR